MNGFDEIQKILKHHKDTVDNIITRYYEDDREPKERFKEDYYLSAHQKNLIDKQADLHVLQQKTADDLNFELNYIQEDLVKWVTRPMADEKKFNLLMSMFSSGVELSEAEIEAFANVNGDSYFAARTLEKIAEKSGVSSPWKYCPFHLDDYISALQNIKNQCDVFVSGYVGEKPCRDLFGSDNTPADYIINVASGCLPFTQNSAVLAAQVLWSRDGVPITKKQLLDETDWANLGRLYEDTPDMGKRTEEIVRQNPELKNLIELSPYKSFLKNTTDDVSENEN